MMIVQIGVEVIDEQCAKWTMTTTAPMVSAKEGTSDGA